MNQIKTVDGGLTTAEKRKLGSEDASTRRTHVAILGTGFSGLGMAIRLKKSGYTDFLIMEKAPDVGGTWRDNTYPGCACDIPSHLYSFSFAPNPDWSHAYSGQEEIQQYLRDCVRRFEIASNILWSCEMLNARWLDQEEVWEIKTSRGTILAKVLVLGQGPLSEPALPDISGIKSFEGDLFHSARWNDQVDLTGKRVAVIGTGASAIQFVPQIQPIVDKLLVFQRTPAWILPRADHPIPEWQKKLYRFFPLALYLKRQSLYWMREITVLGMVYRLKIMDAGMKQAQKHLTKQVPDEILRKKLTPHYAMGCKRVLVSDDFYPAISKSNVKVTDKRIREIRSRSIVTVDGEEQSIDAIVCATGFQVTDTHVPRHIYGRDGQSLSDIWAGSPQAYLGTTVSGFPNMFLLIGPNTGLGHNSMVYMIESQITYILESLRYMQAQNIQAVDVLPERLRSYNEEVQKRMQGTVWTSGCSSWYLDTRGCNTTIWPGFTFVFRQRTQHFDPLSYSLRLSATPTLASSSSTNKSV